MNEVNEGLGVLQTNLLVIGSPSKSYSALTVMKLKGWVKDTSDLSQNQKLIPVFSTVKAYN